MDSAVALELINNTITNFNVELTKTNANLAKNNAEFNKITKMPKNDLNKQIATNYLRNIKNDEKRIKDIKGQLKNFISQRRVLQQAIRKSQEKPKPTNNWFPFSLFGTRAKPQKREPQTQKKPTNTRASAKVAAEPIAEAAVAAQPRTSTRASTRTSKVAAEPRAEAAVATQPRTSARTSARTSKVAAEPRAEAAVAAQPRTSASQSNVLLKKTNPEEYLKFKFAIIYYIDLRFQYLHEFINNISTILDGYLTTEKKNFDNDVLINLKGIIEQIDSSRYIWGKNTTIRDGYLRHLHSFVEGGYNFDDLTEQDIVDKINQQNAIIAEFLNYIATILKPEAMLLYEGWLSSPEYKQITSNIIDKNLLQSGDNTTHEALKELNALWDADDSQDIPVEYNGEDPSSTDKPVEEYKKAMEEYIKLNSLFKPKITQLGAGGSFSRFKGNTNNKILSRETPVSSNSRSSNSRSNSNRSSNSSLGFDKEDIALLNFVEREVEEGIPYIYSYIQGDIMYLLIVLNKVLEYIDIMAIFFLNRKPVIVVEVYRKRKEGDKKRQDKEVAVSIKKIIDDSIKYKEELRKLCDTNTMFSMIDNIQIYSSLYISIYDDKMQVYDDEMHVYNRRPTGGRKRAVGRPRKTPAKKPTVKASTKKPAKPTAKKPTTKKPTAKKPTTKKPTAKKPTTKKPITKPVAKKPTKK
jgi:hypothetical protein